ncbi:MAG: T9SS type A sorting domain-containing protein [Bacteroidales bacterium]|nr:T9SS type A sorting domain-containing protein [Bacteroidales bacterium]
MAYHKKRLQSLLILCLVFVGTKNLFTQETGYRDIDLYTSVTHVQPMTGIVLWSNNVPANNTNSISLEYSYMLFNSIVSDSGMYNWTEVEDKLNDIVSRKHQAIFRFRYVYPGQQTAVPDYIKNSCGYLETEGITEGKATWFPDWENQELQRFTLEFYREFAERYDNDPRLAFIQVGFGLWGEYHIYDGPFIPGKTFPSKEFQESFFYHLDTVFKITPWSISIDAADDTYSPFSAKPELKNISFGLFDDSFMHEEHSTYTGEYNQQSWLFFGEDRYVTAPAGGEFSYYTDYDQEHMLDLQGPYGRNFEDFTAQYHISYMIGNDQPRYQTMQRIEDAGMACGYRFKILSFRVSPDSSIIEVTNTGVAPFYYDAFVTVNGVRAEASLKGLLNGEIRIFKIPSGGNNPILTIESDWIVRGQKIQYQGTINTAVQVMPETQEPPIVYKSGNNIVVVNHSHVSNTLSLTTMDGKVLFRGINSNTIDYSSYKKGLYLLIISDRDKNYVVKILI